MVERFTEQTYVETAELMADAPEYRRPGRAYPRYELSAKFVLFDEERATLADMEAGSEVLVPVWMHPFHARTGEFAGSAPQVLAIHRSTVGGKRFLIQPRVGTSRIAATPVTGNKTLAAIWDPTGDRVAYPVVRARLGDDSFTIESRSSTAHTVNLTFVSDEPQEPVMSQFGNYQDRAEVLTANWRQSIKTDINHSANTFDNGNVRSWSLRHTKRGVSVLLSAFSRDDIWRLRTFLLNQRGRWKAFSWTDPRDGVVKRFRLGSDVLELNYLNEGAMQTAVRFIEVQE
jgi:hypothetical protein